MIRMAMSLETKGAGIGWLFVALVLAGCAGAPEEEGAENAVARESGTDRVECTGRSRIWFREGDAAEVLLCVARREASVCDRYRVDREGTTYRVTLLARESDCSLPPG
jgi:hypothetical protein